MTNSKAEATYHGKKEVSKWADDFMFTAEESKASEGPKAFMLQGTPDPLGSIAAMAKMYKGEVVRDKFLDITDDERRYYLAEMQKTKLKAPLEAVQLHFMIEGVTRSYTHQMVRQRTAVYAQESLRFAVKEDAASAVALPPYLADTIDLDEWLAGHKERQDSFNNKDSMWMFIERHATPEQHARFLWDAQVEHMDAIYRGLVDAGMPQEDARGLLPHNITTRLNYVTNLRNYQDHAGNRLCTQAQFEWRMVWVRMLEAMKSYCTERACQRDRRQGGDWTDEQGEPNHAVYGCDNWQWKAISELFRPVCYYTGSCQFQADFDRKCSIRDRVQANAKIGRPSEEWHNQHETIPHDEHSAGPRDVRFAFQSDEPVFIGAIHPAEWLLDAGAAR